MSRWSGQRGGRKSIPDSGRTRLHPVALVLWGLFAAALLLVPRLLPDEAALRVALASLGPLAPAAFLIAEALQVIIIPIPGQPIETPGGWLFGLGAALLLASLGAVLGSLVAFTLGRRYGRAWVRAHVAPGTWRKFEHTLGDDGGRVAWLVFWLMLVPAFPRDPLCYLAGLTGISLRRFALIAAVGRPVGLAPWVALGAGGIAIGVQVQLVLLALAALAWLAQRAYVRGGEGARGRVVEEAGSA